MTHAGRSRAWMVSVAAHAAIGTLVLMALGSGHGPRHIVDPTPPARLVWVEPAPAALGVPGGSASVPADPAPIVAPPQGPAAESPSKRAAVQEPAKPLPKPPRLARTGSAKAVARAKPAVPARPAPPVVAPSAATETAPAAGTPAGAARGTAGGATGGLGDTVVPVASVATPPELIDRVVPAYPPRARELEIEGKVVLEVVLDRRGRPEPDIEVLESVKQLDAAAIAAVRQWRFRPARDADGNPVRVVMEIPVRFVLR